MARLLAAVLLAACVLAPAPRGVADEDAPPPDAIVRLPIGAPVTMDGVVDPLEWAEAATTPLGEDGARVRWMQCRGTLLVGFEANGPWPPDARLWLCFTADEEGAGLYAPGAVRLDVEPLGHDRPHLLALRVGPEGKEERVEAVAVGRCRVDGPQASMEIAVDLGFLGVNAMTTAPRRALVLWARPGALGTLTWPADVGLVTPAGGRPPPDLASSAGWGRLEGWDDPDGPGAWPPGTWTGWIEEDEELARRAAEAYSVARLIAGDPDLAKRDAEQVPLLLGNLAWIAEREPLTPTDLLVEARAYRFWNREDEALATLATLDSHPAWRRSPRVLYERALTLESAQRYAEAAGVWDEIAGLPTAASREDYRRMAERARERGAEVEEELARRWEDEARGDLPLVLLRTSKGNVLVLLHAGDVPENVAHFLGLVAERDEDGGLYENARFHRVVGDFLAQVGDPATRTSGTCEGFGTGDGPRKVGVERNRRHGFWRGAVAFARGPAPLNGSQFYVLVSPRPELGTKDYTVFGHVVSGMDVVDRLEVCDVLHEVRVLRGLAAPASPKGDGGDEDTAPGPDGER